MKILVTSRHFKAHENLVEYAGQAVRSLTHFYEDILKAEVILRYERTHKSTKIAEVVVAVHRHTMKAEESSDDFFKSVDAAVAKVRVQLKKFKERLQRRDRLTVRRVREKV